MFSIYLIDNNGKGSYLSVKGKTSWKTKRIAIKHANDIMSCKNPPWQTVLIEIENEFGELVKTIKEKL
jgi:hypothetical protein